jgi:hypothetical protein
MKLHPDSAAILRSIHETKNQLVQAIETTQRTYWKPAYKMPDGSSLVYADLKYVGLHFAFTDGDLSEKEALLMQNLDESFGQVDINDAHLWNSNDYRRTYHDSLRNHYYRFLKLYQVVKVPFSVQLLQIYDSTHRTDYASKARDMFFRFANAITKADGMITSEDEAALLEFKETLYSTGPLAAAIIEKEPTAAESQGAVPVQEETRPLEALSQELSSL